MNSDPAPQQNSAIEFRPAWRKRDPTVERDAELFWQRMKALPPRANVPDRLANLCAAAYLSDELIGVTTARIRDINFLHCKLAMLTVLTAAGAASGLHAVGTSLSNYSHDLLEAWSRENGAEGVMGLGALIQSRNLVENYNWAVYPTTGLALVGYTRSGIQMRVSWFAHARISQHWPGVPDASDYAVEFW